MSETQVPSVTLTRCLVQQTDLDDFVLFKVMEHYSRSFLSL